jgi:hypothetical protein
MKCIRETDGTIRRLDDEKAHKIVKEGKGQYCPRSAWKAAGRPKS